jgi:hypothetical protein
MKRIWTAFVQNKLARDARLAGGVETAAPVHGAAFREDRQSKAYRAGYSHGVDAGREHGLECSLSTAAAGSAAEAMMTLVGVEQMARILGVNVPMEDGRMTPAFATAFAEYNSGFAAGWDDAETAALEQIDGLPLSTGPSLRGATSGQRRSGRLLVNARSAC